jgi:hypothetical protein
MTEEHNHSGQESFEELIISSALEQEALVNLLFKKGIITPAELIEEIKKLRHDH